jgi:hypothetical protein
MMIPQHIYPCNFRYLRGVTSSYVHISDFEDYTEQKKTDFQFRTSRLLGNCCCFAQQHANYLIYQNWLVTSVYTAAFSISLHAFGTSFFLP